MHPQLTLLLEIQDLHTQARGFRDSSDGPSVEEEHFGYEEAARRMRERVVSWMKDHPRCEGCQESFGTQVDPLDIVVMRWGARWHSRCLESAGAVSEPPDGARGRP